MYDIEGVLISATAILKLILSTLCGNRGQENRGSRIPDKASDFAGSFVLWFPSDHELKLVNRGLFETNLGKNLSP